MSEEQKETKLADILLNAKTEDIDAFMKNLEKADKVLKTVESLATRLDKIGILPAVIRGLGKKYDIPDIDKPINNPLSVIAPSPIHKVVYNALNALPEAEIRAYYEQLILAQGKAHEKGEKNKKEEKKD